MTVCPYMYEIWQGTCMKKSFSSTKNLPLYMYEIMLIGTITILVLISINMHKLT